MRIGREAGAAHGVEFVAEDWRPGFRAGRQESREMGLYQQFYCGCILSEAERYSSPGAGVRNQDARARTVSGEEERKGG